MIICYPCHKHVDDNSYLIPLLAIVPLLSFSVAQYNIHIQIY